MAKDKDKKKARPIHKFMSGSVTISAWENESKNGNKFLNYTIQKRYFDGKEWQDSTSFNMQDLPTLEKLAVQAWNFGNAYAEKMRDKNAKNSDSDSDDDDEEDDD